VLVALFLLVLGRLPLSGLLLGGALSGRLLLRELLLGQRLLLGTPSLFALALLLLFAFGVAQRGMHALLALEGTALLLTEGAVCRVRHGRLNTPLPHARAGLARRVARARVAGRARAIRRAVASKLPARIDGRYARMHWLVGFPAVVDRGKLQVSARVWREIRRPRGLDIVPALVELLGIVHRGVLHEASGGTQRAA
jgi:hypothetical protein